MKRFYISLLTAVLMTAAGPAFGQGGGETRQGVPPDFSALAEARLGAVATIAPAKASEGRNRPGGSGFAMDAGGLFITHAAVLQGASTVQVVLADGTTLEGTVAATDQESGIALMETHSPDRLPVLPWASAPELPLGSWLVAFGRPQPDMPTIAVGIVSAPVGELIRSDLGIGPANLGGPVLNATGRVVGLGIVTEGAGGAPVGAILPADRVREAVNALSAQARESREPARLGVVVQPLDDKLAEALGTKEDAGVVIAAVKSGSPAEADGLQPGDVITRFGDKTVTTPAQLRELVRQAGTKAPVEVTVERNGETRNLSVRLAKAAAIMAGEKPKVRADAAETESRFRLGVRVTDLTEQIAQQLGLSDVSKGAVVVAVHKGSPAAEAGVRPGDVILSIGDRTVETAEDLVEALKDMKQEGKTSAALRVYRDGSYQFVPVTV